MFFLLGPLILEFSVSCEILQKVTDQGILAAQILCLTTPVSIQYL